MKKKTATSKKTTTARKDSQCKNAKKNDYPGRPKGATRLIEYRNCPLKLKLRPHVKECYIRLPKGTRVDIIEDCILKAYYNRATGGGHLCADNEKRPPKNSPLNCTSESVFTDEPVYAEKEKTHEREHKAEAKELTAGGAEYKKLAEIVQQEFLKRGYTLTRNKDTGVIDFLPPAES